MFLSNILIPIFVVGVLSPMFNNYLNINYQIKIYFLVCNYWEDKIMGVNLKYYVITIFQYFSNRINFCRNYVRWTDMIVEQQQQLVSR